MDRMQRKIELAKCWWFIVGCLVVSLVGCGHVPYTPTQKALIFAMCLTNGADALATIDNQPYGQEKNFILGEHPSDDNILLFKGLLVLGAIGFGELWPDSRNMIFPLVTGIGLGGAVSNRFSSTHRYRGAYQD